jgi:hypothetical protein
LSGAQGGPGQVRFSKQVSLAMSDFEFKGNGYVSSGKTIHEITRNDTNLFSVA